MSNYLANATEWQPVLFVPKNTNYLIKDVSLEKEVDRDIEVIRYPIWEPNNLLLRLGFKSYLKQVAAGGIGRSKHKTSFLKKVAIWVRSNLFIPDARAFWIKPASKFLINYLSENKVDAVVSTGPPHSTHLIALNVKNKLNIPWVADYRDPWTFIDFFDDMNLTSSSLERHKVLEKKVMNFADRVVFVTKSWAEQQQKIYHREIDVIHNGFDPRDFKNLTTTKNEKFTIIHIGSLNKDRNPILLFECLKQLKDENHPIIDELKIKIIGSVVEEVRETVEKLGIIDLVEIISSIPHKEVLNELKSAHVSLLLVNRAANMAGIVPGKLYEYLAIKNPILAIGNTDGDSAKIIKECDAGVVVDFDDGIKLKSVLLNLYNSINHQKNQIKDNGIEKYSRKNLALKYAQLLDELIKSQ